MYIYPDYLHSLPSFEHMFFHPTHTIISEPHVLIQQIISLAQKVDFISLVTYIRPFTNNMRERKQGYNTTVVGKLNFEAY